MTEQNTKRGYLVGALTALALLGGSLAAGAMGVGSDQFPADVSVRSESTQSGRLRGVRGLRGGK